MDTLNITATANGLNYLPEYVADKAGIFASHGLQVSSVARDPWTGVLDDIDSGAADIALGGLWVPAMFAGTPREISVVGQLNHKFPMTVISRDDRPESNDLSWLSGKVALAPGAGGSAPYEFTAGLMREQGLDPHSARWVRDLSTAMEIELYKAGLGDAIVLDLVSATELATAGYGKVVFRHLDAGGVMPNSVYYCRTDKYGDIKDRADRFMVAIGEGMAALRAGSVDAEIDAVLAERWPNQDHGLLRDAARQMVAGGVWDSNQIDSDASDRWMRILWDGGLTQSEPSLARLQGAAAAVTTS